MLKRVQSGQVSLGRFDPGPGELPGGGNGGPAFMSSPILGSMVLDFDELDGSSLGSSGLIGPSGFDGGRSLAPAGVIICRDASAEVVPEVGCVLARVLGTRGCEPVGGVAFAALGTFTYRH